MMTTTDNIVRPAALLLNRAHLPPLCCTTLLTGIQSSQLE